MDVLLFNIKQNNYYILKFDKYFWASYMPSTVIGIKEGIPKKDIAYLSLWGYNLIEETKYLALIAYSYCAFIC